MEIILLLEGYQTEKIDRSGKPQHSQICWLTNSSISFPPSRQLLTSLKSNKQIDTLDRKLGKARALPCSLLSHTVSYSNDILLIKEWIMWLFILHSCHAFTLSSTEDPKMSKTRFFCLPDVLSIYFKNWIYTAQEASNCALHKFHHKHKETTCELCFFLWIFRANS